MGSRSEGSRSGKDIAKDYAATMRACWEQWKRDGQEPPVKEDGTVNVAKIAEITQIPYRRFGTNPKLAAMVAEMNDELRRKQSSVPDADTGAIAQLRQRLNMTSRQLERVERHALDRDAENAARSDEIAALTREFEKREREYQHRIRQLEEQLERVRKDYERRLELRVDLVADTGLWPRL